MSLIFSTVSDFVEQVGRRQTWKWGDLDVMVCTWNGPSAGVLGFKPKVNSPHPQYPLMFVTDSQITNQEALVAYVEVTYQGIIQARGPNYITEPILSVSQVQGSRDFETSYVQQLTPDIYTAVPNPGGAPLSLLTAEATYLVGTRTLNVRYWGQQASVRYQAIPEPSAPHYSGLGLGHVRWQILSQYYGPVNAAANGIGKQYIQQAITNLNLPPPGTYPPLFATFMGFQKEQRGKWYNVTEVYGPTF